MQKRTAAGLAALATVMGMMAATPRHVKLGQASKTIRPVTAVEHSLTSVKILSAAKDAGGSGVILSSTSIGSNILTNKHVCELVQAGGFVQTGAHTEYRVQAYKIYPVHDLCLINVMENLGINIVIADKEPEVFSDCRVSGHPSLLPMILAPGHFSQQQKVNLIVDARSCTGHEIGKDKAYCAALGGIPITRLYEAQITSSLIMPGSSGSAVFNKEGELAGLVFAGNGELSYAHIVPWKFVADFITNAEAFKWNYPDADAPPKKFMKMILKTISICDRHARDIGGICGYAEMPAIWKKNVR